MNKKAIIAVIALMCVLLALKWAGQRQTSQSAGGGGETASELPPAGPEAAVGIALPAGAETQFPASASYAQSVSPAQLNSTQEQVDERLLQITGPAAMSRAKCMAFYGDYPKAVAFYAQGLGAKNVSEYAVCHVIASSDDSFCGFVAGPGRQQCDAAVLYHRVVYSAMIGKMDMELCRKYFNMQKAFMPSGAPPVDKICKNIEDTLGGPKAQQALTACVGGADKRDCVLHADVLAGVKQGKGRLWLYDALTGKGCAKADHELVDQYCSGKIVRARRGPENKK